MRTKEKPGHLPTSLRGLMQYKKLYYSRWKADREQFGRLFFVGCVFKRVRWQYNNRGEINGDVLQKRTQRGFKQLSRKVCRKFPKIFSRAARKSYGVK